jgi:hypothetical protein
MEIAEADINMLQEMIRPKPGKIRENHGIVDYSEFSNKRLDDINTHLVDQSRRIDDTNKRIDKVRSELNSRIDNTNKRIDKVCSELTAQISEVRSMLSLRLDGLRSDPVSRLDANNERIDRFLPTAATKEEQAGIDARLFQLEQGLEGVRQRLAA